MTTRLDSIETSDNSELSESDSALNNQQQQQRRKQQAFNFFDFEDDEDQDLQQAGIGQSIATTTTNIAKSPSNTSADVVKISTLKKPENDKKFGPLKFDHQNIDERAQELIETTVNAIINSNNVSNNSPTSSNTTRQLSPRQAVERIFAGDHDVNLTGFRGKEQKLELLDYAVLTGDKYTMTMVTIPKICFYFCFYEHCSDGDCACSVLVFAMIEQR